MCCYRIYCRVTRVAFTVNFKYEHANYAVFTEIRRNGFIGYYYFFFSISFHFVPTEGFLLTDDSGGV